MKLDRCSTRPLSRLLGRVGVGALSAVGFAEAAPPRLALLGALPRKRERENHPPGHHQISAALLTRRAHLGKPLADAQQQGVTDFAIGLQLLLAIALGAGRIVGWPV